MTAQVGRRKKDNYAGAASAAGRFRLDLPTLLTVQDTLRSDVQHVPVPMAPQTTQTNPAWKTRGLLFNMDEPVRRSHRPGACARPHQQRCKVIYGGLMPFQMSIAIWSHSLNMPQKGHFFSISRDWAFFVRRPVALAELSSRRTLLPGVIEISGPTTSAHGHKGSRPVFFTSEGGVGPQSGNDQGRACENACQDVRLPIQSSTFQLKCIDVHPQGAEGD